MGVAAQCAEEHIAIADAANEDKGTDGFRSGSVSSSSVRLTGTTSASAHK